MPVFDEKQRPLSPIVTPQTKTPHSSLGEVGHLSHEKIELILRQIDEFQRSLPGIYLTLSSMSAANALDLIDGGTTSLHSHAGLLTPYYNAVDVYRCTASPGGGSTFTALISSVSGASVVYKAPITGTEAALVVNSTSQLAKMRLYNTTRGNYALISQSVVATKTVTLTANAPAGWAANDAITIASQTVSGGALNWIDLECTDANLIGKTQLGLNFFIRSATVGDQLDTHPFETYGAGKDFPIPSLVANITNAHYQPIKLTSNCFAIAWSGTPTLIMARICQKDP